MKTKIDKLSKWYRRIRNGKITKVVIVEDKPRFRAMSITGLYLVKPVLPRWIWGATFATYSKTTTDLRPAWQERTTCKYVQM